MKPHLLVIPGFGEDSTDAPYHTLKKNLEGKFRVTMHTPKWNYSTPSMWLHELSKTLDVVDTSNMTVIAFSLGAYIALLASQKHKFKKIILCSLSPFFREQMQYMPKTARAFLGKRRVADFNTHPLPKTVSPAPIFLFGAKDWAVGIDEARKMAKKYGGTFEIVQNAHHELPDDYIQKIVAFAE